MELFDYKPTLEKYRGENLPDSIRNGQRLTGMSAGQASFPIAPSIFKFSKKGKCGADWSELMPFTGELVDDFAIVRSMNTEAINHDPAITFFQTGTQLPGRPSIGSWLATGSAARTRTCPPMSCSLARHRPARRPAALRPPLGQRIPADSASRGEVPQHRRPGALPFESARRGSRHAPIHAR